MRQRVDGDVRVRMTSAALPSPLGQAHHDVAKLLWLHPMTSSESKDLATAWSPKTSTRQQCQQLTIKNREVQFWRCGRTGHWGNWNGRRGGGNRRKRASVQSRGKFGKNQLPSVTVSLRKMGIEKGSAYTRDRFADFSRLSSSCNAQTFVVCQIGIEELLHHGIHGVPSKAGASSAIFSAMWAGSGSGPSPRS